MEGWGEGEQWHGSIEWMGDEPTLPDEAIVVPARRTYTRWPWGQWASGMEYKFAGEFGGKSPQQMATMWRNWARVHGRTVHVYFAADEQGLEHVLMSMHPLDPTHDRLNCERCGDERKMTSRRNRRP